MAIVQPTEGKRAKKRRSKSRLDRLRLALEKALIVINELSEADLNALGSDARLKSIDESLRKLSRDRLLPRPGGGG